MPPSEPVDPAARDLRVVLVAGAGYRTGRVVVGDGALTLRS